MRTANSADAATTAPKDAEPTGRLFPHPYLLGGVCWVSWVMLLYGGGMRPFSADVVTAAGQTYVVSTAAVALASLLLAVFPTQAYRLLGSPRFMGAMGAAASVGTVALLAGSQAGSVVAAQLGSFATGLGTGCLSMRLGCQSARLNPRGSLLAAVLVMAASLLLCSLMVNVHPAVMAPVMVALPLLGVAASFLPGGSVDPQDNPRAPGRRQTPLVVGLFALMLILFLASGFLPYTFDFNHFSVQEQSNVLFSLVAMGVIAAVAMALPAKVRFETLYYWGSMAILALYGVAALGHFDFALITLFFTTANVILNVIAWGLLACVCHGVGTRTVTLFGLGRALIDFTSPLGYLMGGHQLILSGGFGAVFGALLILVVALFSVLGFLKRDALGAAAQSDIPAGNTGSADANPDPQTTPDAGSDPSVAKASADGKPRWRTKMLQAAQDAGLTKRETEVFLLLAKGRDAQSVADEMQVSLSTARTHVRGIYTKLDVHSRHEFQRYVAQVESGEKDAQ